MDLIKLLGLNVDPNRPIHYIIGVAVYSHPADKKRGQLYVKYGPIVFTNKDVENLKMALETHKMEIPKTSLDDALEVFEVKSLVSNMSGFMMACRANDCSIHHFSTDEALTDKYFDDMVEFTNKNDGLLKTLMEAEIGK
jgi:hypothetical protein